MPHDSTLDPLAILGALGITAVTSATVVQGGMDTSLWRVEHGGRTSALRVFRPGTEATYQREIAALEAAEQARLPIPRVEVAGMWRDRPALLLSWCAGVPLSEALQRWPWRFAALGRAFGQAQAKLHQHRAALPQALAQADWVGWAGGLDPALAGALQRLIQPEPALLHLDYHPLNVLTDGRQITAVLDWANARAGDPRADVARTYTILRVEPYSPGRQPLGLTIKRRALTWAWQRGYASVAGPPRDMAWFYVWAGMAMARDLAPRVANPQSWWEPRHLAQIQAWTAGWRRRAGQ